MTTLYRWHASVTRGPDRIVVCDCRSAAAEWLQRRMGEAIGDAENLRVIDSLNRGKAEVVDLDLLYVHWTAGDDVFVLRRHLALGHGGHLDTETWETVARGGVPSQGGPSGACSRTDCSRCRPVCGPGGAVFDQTTT